jgi:ABC-2 type transport system ATP-binding protein
VLAVMERLRKYTTIFYSTHILEDVQRVSDTVAILNHGQLVAEAPIQELLVGKGSSVMFQVVVKGNAERAQERVGSQPWVQQILSTEKDGQTSWQVCVSDENAAEDQLLRLILEERDTRVLRFGRKTYNLEEVFMSIIEGSN